LKLPCDDSTVSHFIAFSGTTRLNSLSAIDL